MLLMNLLNEPILPKWITVGKIETLNPGVVRNFYSCGSGV